MLANDYDPAHTPEQALWQAVLFRTVEDALYSIAEGGNYQNRLRLCTEARDYLTTPSQDLSIACAGAGLDMSAVIEAMRKRIAEAPAPEEVANTRVSTKPKTPKKQRKPRSPFKDRIFTINGTSRTAEEWSARTGVSMPTMQVRISKGWAIDRAITMTTAQAQAEAKANRRRLAAQDVRNRQAKQKRQEAKAKSREYRPSAYYTYKGETFTLAEWAARTGINKQAIYKRIHRSSWSVADALETPVSRRGA